MSREDSLAQGEGQGGLNWRVAMSRFLEAGVGLILLAAGLLKAYQPLDFIQQISDYKLISAPVLIKVAAWVMIAVECALGAALIAGYKRRIAIPATIVLFLVFIAMVGWAWSSGATEDCGCFGSWVKRTPAEALLEDLGLLSLIVVSRLLSRREPARFLRWRLGAIVTSVLVGISLTVLASNSPRQSSDPLVRLQAQSDRPRPFAGLKVSDLEADLNHGRYIVALIDTWCTHCQESVPSLNQLSEARGGQPAVVALCSNSADDVRLFKQNFNPKFPIGRIGYDDFMRLFERGKTPRIMLVRDGVVLKIWDGAVPSVINSDE